jgi:hypothetical protein
VLVKNVMAEVVKQPKFKLHLNSRVTRVQRTKGNVKVTYRDEKARVDRHTSGPATCLPMSIFKRKALKWRRLVSDEQRRLYFIYFRNTFKRIQHNSSLFMQFSSFNF